MDKHDMLLLPIYVLFVEIVCHYQKRGKLLEHCSKQVLSFCVLMVKTFMSYGENNI